MLILLAPHAYRAYCLDPVNSDLANREPVVQTIVGAFNMFLSMNVVEIPTDLRIRQPTVSIYLLRKKNSNLISN